MLIEQLENVHVVFEYMGSFQFAKNTKFRFIALSNLLNTIF